MFQQSHSLLQSAQKVHAELELYYDNALDVTRFNQLCEQMNSLV